VTTPIPKRAIVTNSPLVVGLGEVLWDVFPNARKPGGAPANVAFQAGQLGGRGAVASRIGRDEPGDELLTNLEQRRLDLSAMQRDAEHPTGRVTVDVSDPHHPTYVIHENVAWDFIAADPALLGLAARADAICFGSLAQRSPVSRAAIHAALGAARDTCLVVFDVNLRQHWWDAEGIARSIEAADIVKLNHDEVAALAPVLKLPAEPREFAAGLLRRHAAQVVCVTRAEHGCLLIGRSDAVDLPGVKVNVVDAVGAGDAFSAALIVATLRGWPLRSAGRLANQVGALVATRPGAMPDLVTEFADLWQRTAPAL
jgi:fructokinase